MNKEYEFYSTIEDCDTLHCTDIDEAIMECVDDLTIDELAECQRVEVFGFNRAVVSESFVKKITAKIMDIMDEAINAEDVRLGECENHFIAEHLTNINNLVSDILNKESDIYEAYSIGEADLHEWIKNNDEDLYCELLVAIEKRREMQKHEV